MLHEEILQAMGVEILRPRFTFSHAAEEDLTAYSQQIEALQQQGTTQTVSASASPPVSAADARQALLDEMSQIDGYVAAERAKQSTLRFKLRLVRLDQYIMLLDQPGMHWPEEQTALRFFADIYHALQGRPPQQWQQVVFEWPPGKNYPVIDEKEQVKSLLHSYIQQMLQGQNQACLLIWGDIEQVLFEQKLSVGMRAELGAYQVLQLHKPQYYWQQPEEKRQLWQHLQAIKSA